ncbi:hypothetical protein DFH11DRAFT_903007 [Phellopilus nigrolimitatus]|nr:hypothetical protein DFH11DRAFT_903007 [Phellopilus nigrolimitatus]
MAGRDSVNGINETDPDAKVDLALWFFFQIAADNIALPILVSTFLFAKKVKRTPALINMCITFIIAGVSSSLLLYAGKESGEEPGHVLCAAQTSLLYGVLPIIKEAEGTSRSYIARFSQVTLLIIPYLGFLGFTLSTSIVSVLKRHELLLTPTFKQISAQNIDKVNRARRFFYCSIKHEPLTNAIGLFTAVVCLLSVMLEIHVAICIWRVFRALEVDNNPSGRGLDRQLIVRLFVFTGYLLVALAFSAASVKTPKTAVPDIFSASIGMAVFLVFGTHPDVLRVWAFWLPSRPPPLPPKDLREPATNRVCNLSGPRTLDNIDLRSDAENLRSLNYTEPKSRSNLFSSTSVKNAFRLEEGHNVTTVGRSEEAFDMVGRHNIS